jgi:hypothetical protein
VSEDAGRSGHTGTETPERPGGTANFFRAINVARNAKIGFGIGTVLAVLLLVSVIQGASSAQYSMLHYAGLAFVLATGTGLLLTIVFTTGSLVRKVRELD